MEGRKAMETWSRAIRSLDLEDRRNMERGGSNDGDNGLDGYSILQTFVFVSY